MWKVIYNLEVTEGGIEKTVESGFSKDSPYILDIGEYKIDFVDFCNLIQFLSNNKNNKLIYIQTSSNEKEKVGIKLDNNHEKIFFGKYKIGAMEFIDFIKIMFATPLLQYPPTEASKIAALAIYAIADSKNSFFKGIHSRDIHGRTIEDYIEQLNIDEIFTNGGNLLHNDKYN